MGNKSRNNTGKKWAQVRNMAAANMPSSRSAPRVGAMPADTVRRATGSTDYPLRTVKVFAPSSVFHDSSRAGTYRKPNEIAGHV